MITDKNIPEIRFPEFNAPFNSHKLGELTKINQGLQIAISKRLTSPVDGAQFYITNEFLKEGNKKEYYIQNPPESVVCDEEDVLMTRTGNTGQVVTGVKGAFHNNFFKIKYDSNSIDKDYLVNFLRLHKTQNQILRYAGTSTIPDLNHSDFYRLEINLPSLSEQEKTAKFLSSVDQRINLLEQKRDALERYKKGVMQKLFSQEIRFKDENGNDFPDWEEKRLGELLHEHKEKNVLGRIDEVFSVSKAKGVVNQLEHLGRSYSSDSINHYKVANPYDVIYTKSPTSDFPFGVIKQNLTERSGVVSPLYGVFKPINQRIGFLIHCYFLSHVKAYNYLNPLVNRGVKNTMNISNDTFLNGARLEFPDSEVEQERIAMFLASVDKLLGNTEKRIAKMKDFKKGLLQKMFV